MSRIIVLLAIWGHLLDWSWTAAASWTVRHSQDDVPAAEVPL